MIFLDANIFLAYHNKEDSLHKRAIALFKEIEKGTYGDYFTSDYVVNEVVGVTFRKIGKKEAVSLGQQILSSLLVINVNEVLLERSWDFFTKTSLSLNLVDCTNIIVAQFVNTQYIATFDKEFKKLKNMQIIE